MKNYKKLLATALALSMVAGISGPVIDNDFGTIVKANNEIPAKSRFEVEDKNENIKGFFKGEFCIYTNPEDETTRKCGSDDFIEGIANLTNVEGTVDVVIEKAGIKYNVTLLRKNHGNDANNQNQGTDLYSATAISLVEPGNPGGGEETKYELKVYHKFADEFGAFETDPSYNEDYDLTEEIVDFTNVAKHEYYYNTYVKGAIQGYEGVLDYTETEVDTAEGIVTYIVNIYYVRKAIPEETKYELKVYHKFADEFGAFETDPSYNEDYDLTEEIVDFTNVAKHEYYYNTYVKGAIQGYEGVLDYTETEVDTAEGIVTYIVNIYYVRKAIPEETKYELKVYHKFADEFGAFETDPSYNEDYDLTEEIVDFTNVAKHEYYYNTYVKGAIQGYEGVLDYTETEVDTAEGIVTYIVNIYYVRKAIPEETKYELKVYHKFADEFGAFETDPSYNEDYDLTEEIVDFTNVAKHEYYYNTYVKGAIQGYEGVLDYTETEVDTAEESVTYIVNIYYVRKESPKKEGYNLFVYHYFEDKDGNYIANSKFDEDYKLEGPLATFGEDKATADEYYKNKVKTELKDYKGIPSLTKTEIKDNKEDGKNYFVHIYYELDETTPPTVDPNPKPDPKPDPKPNPGPEEEIDDNETPEVSPEEPTTPEEPEEEIIDEEETPEAAPDNTPDTSVQSMTAWVALFLMSFLAIVTEFFRRNRA